jgi:hypothetical protein
MTFRDPGDGVSKRERRAFALGVKRRLLPRAQHVESLLGLAEGAGVFRMQIEATRTPIDLRGAHLHQVDQRFLQASVVDVMLDLIHPAERFRNIRVVDTSFRRRLSLLLLWMTLRFEGCCQSPQISTQHDRGLARATCQ